MNCKSDGHISAQTTFPSSLNQDLVFVYRTDVLVYLLYGKLISLPIDLAIHQQLSESKLFKNIRSRTRRKLLDWKEDQHQISSLCPGKADQYFFSYLLPGQWGDMQWRILDPFTIIPSCRIPANQSLIIHYLLPANKIIQLFGHKPLLPAHSLSSQPTQY